ncbi:MAG: Gfo/Idh/MocA family oxidoreductase, partial [Candidatus Omnitrophica bacterium]|nr:Gfo/Idh/MocA family oxidoreductase [Candidatus Omnitrophota bacterium]
MKRRSFIQNISVGAGALTFPSLIPRSVLAAPNRPGANDRIQVGLIGPGGRAHSLIEESPLDIKIVAFADCDLRQIESFNKWMQEKRPEIGIDKIARYQDYHEMFDKEKLDAVIIATTTHSRALICLDAMMAGLDVYAEKPLTLTIEEGQYLMRAEKAYGTVFQTGTQQRSVPADNYASDLVKNGAIGKIHTVLAPNYLGVQPRPDFPGEPCPEELNWDMWCNQTDLIPYTSKLHPSLSKWGLWRPYDGAGQSFGVTGWGAHAFDQVQRALGTDHTTPSEIWLEEDPGPNAKVSLRYEDGPVMKLEYGMNEGPGLGAIFVGDKGRIEIERNIVKSDPPELLKDAPPPSDPSPVSSVAVMHLQNWIDCMRSREKPNASAEIGHHSSVICHQINICRELGRNLKWDPVKEEFIG